MAEINNLPTNVSDGQTGHLNSHQVIHAALKDHESRVGGAESDIQATRTTANQALSTANSARDAASLAETNAIAALTTSGNVDDRVDALEAMNGVSPESPVDGQTANLIAQPDTLTRAALETSLAPVYGARISNPSQIGADVEKRIHGKKVLVIFRHDDVQPSALAYLPVYRKYGVKASWYMTTGHAGSSQGPNSAPIVTWEQLDEIFADGHEIGSHTVNHAYINTQSLTDAEWEKELEDSKRALEDRYGHTGYTCDTLALPGNQIPTTDATENIALDYYMTLLSGGPICSSLKGEQELVTWRNGHHFHWLDYTGMVRNPGATLETDRAAVRARINEIAEYDDGAGGISVIQAHNQSELSVPQLEMMLEEFAADDRVAVITVRDWVHYCRRKYVTTDGGKHFYPPRDANSLVHEARNIRTSGLSVSGDMTLNGPSTGIYYNADGAPQFRIYQNLQTNRLRVRDMMDAKDVLTITRGTSTGPSIISAEDFFASVRFSLSNYAELPNPIRILLGAGPPTAALGVVHKGSLYLQGGGDPDSCLWVKTTAGTGGWKLVGQHEATRTSAQIMDRADTINTEAKVAGRRVFDTTLNKPLWATGVHVAAQWVDATGTVVHEPV